ncbi:MAG TPA: hypothetical protein PK926_05055 [Spirochaetota bacterium]|nr:hypothetical protein [Spirochaetota bacterium]HPI88169.1 hypothetical protein [Spirochaetota bacterium]HPR47944.1 hypothetical protein [Spirochaetota bacterium]
MNEKEKHILFQRMSQLIDNDIATEEEKNFVLDHIESCDFCKREYARLQEMMRYFSRLRSIDHLNFDLSSRIIEKYSSRRRKVFFRKVIPAAAAAAVFIFALGINNSLQNTSVSSNMAQLKMEKPASNDTRNVIAIISHNNASIIKVTDLYIEGEVSKADYSRLRKDLGFRKVVFSLSKNDNGTVMKNIEEVGTLSGSSSDGVPGNANQNESIRFRVYK